MEHAPEIGFSIALSEATIARNHVLDKFSV